jgi:hypothetical protein
MSKLTSPLQPSVRQIVCTPHGRKGGPNLFRKRGTRYTSKPFPATTAILDLFLGGEPRVHDDLEIVVDRASFVAVAAAGVRINF